MAFTWQRGAMCKPFQIVEKGLLNIHLSLTVARSNVASSLSHTQLLATLHGCCGPILSSLPKHAHTHTRAHTHTHQTEGQNLTTRNCTQATHNASQG